MIWFLLMVLVLLLLSLKSNCDEISYNNNYLKIENTVCINGFFVLFNTVKSFYTIL